MHKLLMPKLWRLLFQNIDSLETDSVAYQRLKDCLIRKAAFKIPNEAVKTWNADQNTGRLNIVLNNEKTLTASYQIIGSHDGQSFLWADANSSVMNKKLSLRLRDALSHICPKLGEADKLDISYRDMEAITLFGADALNLERIFVAHSANAYIAMSITEITVTEPLLEAKKEKWSFTGLLRKKTETAETTSTANIFDFTNILLTDQLKAVTLDAESLIRFEPQLIAINQAYENECYSEALELIGAAKSDLGQFYQDQEPIGWLSYCEGACNLMLGHKEAAYACFQIALRAVDVPDVDLTKLGLARSSDDEELYKSNLISLFISNPDWCLETVSPDEKHIIQTHVSKLEELREETSHNAEAVLKAALQDRFDQEKRAHQQSSEASKHRAQSHVLCEADETASQIIDQEYRDILLKWFTLPRAASMASYGSDPDENLDNLVSFEIINESSESMTALVKFECDFGGEAEYRYELVMESLPLSTKRMWRLHEIWSLWDAGDIKMH